MAEPLQRILDEFRYPPDGRYVETRLSESVSETFDHLLGLHDPRDPENDRLFRAGEEGTLRSNLINQLVDGTLSGVAIVAPAGSGKTIITGEIAAKLNSLGISVDKKEFDVVIEELKDRYNFPRQLSKWQDWHWRFFNNQFFEYSLFASPKPVLLPDGSVPNKVVTIIESSWGVKSNEDKARTMIDWTARESIGQHPLYDQLRIADELTAAQSPAFAEFEARTVAVTEQQAASGSLKFVFIPPDRLVIGKTISLRQLVQSFARSEEYFRIWPVLEAQHIQVIGLEQFMRQKYNDPDISITFQTAGKEVVEKILDMGPPDRVDDGYYDLCVKAYDIYKRGELEVVQVPHNAIALENIDDIDNVSEVLGIISLMEYYRKKFVAQTGISDELTEVGINAYAADRITTLNAGMWDPIAA